MLGKYFQTLKIIAYRRLKTFVCLNLDLNEITFYIYICIYFNETLYKKSMNLRELFQIMQTCFLKATDCKWLAFLFVSELHS